MPVIVLRHGERIDYIDRSWVGKAERPWDPPLTESGKEMALRAGAAIREFCSHHSLPPPSVLLSSPLLRCVQTSAEAARGMELTDKIKIEPALCETICEDWYLSWAVPGADGSWGGPEGRERGATVAPEDMHPAALSPLKDLFHPATTLSDLCGGCVDEAYAPSVPAGSMDYTWAQYESAHGTDKATGHRIGGFCSRFAADNPDITFVVCTHGGPSAACYEHLTGQDFPQVVGYTAIHVLVRDSEARDSGARSGADQGGGWRALVSGSTAHL